MDEVYELSSDSSDTLCYNVSPKGSPTRLNNNSDVEDSFEKYSEGPSKAPTTSNGNYKPFTVPGRYTLSDDDDDVDIAEIPTTPPKKFGAQSDEILSILNAKYNLKGEPEKPAVKKRKGAPKQEQQRKTTPPKKSRSRTRSAEILTVGAGSSDDESMGLTDKERQKLLKEAQKREKIQERERKKQEAEVEKSLKRAMSEVNKNMNPDECVKFITVHVDNEIINQPYGHDILKSLQSINATCKVEQQIFPHTITWTRTQPNHYMDSDGKLGTFSASTETNEVLLLMNHKDLIKKIGEDSLKSQLEQLKSIRPNKDIHLCVLGLNHYYRYLKNSQNREFAQNIITNPQKRKASDDRVYEDLKEVTRSQIELALVELQLWCDCSHRLVHDGVELGNLVAQFTKSIAQSPYKEKQQEKFELTEWYASGDNKDCVKVDKNGHGLGRLWNQILTMFPLARLETADAICTKYPTLRSLIEGCQEGQEGLLQDIPIRRAAGPLSSSKKIGPELSRKVYRFYTSTDGDSIL